jgi:hypothetical protein
MGPLAQARFADPRALVVAASFTLVAGGVTGTVQALRGGALEVVSGRYPQTTPTGAFARFRDTTFGSIGGVAYDGASTIYVSETSSSANKIDVITIVDPTDAKTWTIAPLAATFSPPLNQPTGLYVDTRAQRLYVADTGNHVIRTVDLVTNGVATVAGELDHRGLFGDGGPATSALLYAPQAITTCSNGDLFIADTGNNRIRRVTGGMISTVLGDGVPASSGEGAPATAFPINAPMGLACDALGNLYATSSTAVRQLPADATGVVDGTGPVLTIFGRAPAMFPATVTRCLTGIAVVDARTVHVVDACAGMLVQLTR